jgi:hypothetical protein
MSPRKFLAFILTVVLSQAVGARAVCAQTGSNSNAQTVEQIKSKVARMGTGEKARVTVRMKNGQKLKGYIAQTQENSFTLRDRKTDAPTEVAYSDVAKVESNRGHSTARGLGLGIGIGVGVAVLTLAIIVTHLD